MGGGEVSLGRSSYGEGGMGLRSCCPTTSQYLGPPGSWLLLLWTLLLLYLLHAEVEEEWSAVEWEEDSSKFEIPNLPILVRNLEVTKHWQEPGFLFQCG